MTLQETIRQVKAEICEDRKQIAHTRLESIAGAENPYSLKKRTPSHPQRCDSVCDTVPGGRGATEDAHQLHQRDPGGDERDRRVRGPDQLRHQGGSGAGEMQRCCAPEVEAEWAVVLCFSGDQGRSP